jgi:hypothetical protein
MKALIDDSEIDDINPAQNTMEDCPQYRVVCIVAYGNCQRCAKGNSGGDEISLVNGHGGSPVFEFSAEKQKGISEKQMI